MAPTPVSLADPETKKLWDAINQIPDTVLEEYLADNVIDEREMEDIANRLGTMCQKHTPSLSLDINNHKMIRSLIHHAVEHIRHQRFVGKQIEDKLCNVSLQEIKQAMGNLLNSGQIKLGTQHLDRDTHAFEMGDIPEPPEKEEEKEE